MQKGVLIIVHTFSPNTGGVETHMDDLVKVLNERDYRVFVQTYSPITTPGVKWKANESFGNVQIRRYKWFGRNILHKIEKNPALVFLYITPYLFLRVFFFLLVNHKKIDVIHAQGLNSALIGKYLKILFKKKLVVSIHAIYEIKANSLTVKFIRNILFSSDIVLTLSEASYKELISFGLRKENLYIYRYWIDLEIFRPLNNKKEFRKKLNLADGFTVLFVGRLTTIKGIKELVEVAKRLLSINFVFIGNGPLEGYLKNQSYENTNISFIYRVDNKELYKYYNAADVLCIPSQYEEGFGRVAIEAVSCGLPIVGSNKGGLIEAVDSTVSILVNPTIDNLTSALLKLQREEIFYQKLKNNCRFYAERKFSSKNIEKITRHYS